MGARPHFLTLASMKTKPGLAEVDVDDAGPVGADRGEEVLRLEAVDDVVELLAVAREEDGARAGSVAYADNVALDDLGGRSRSA